MLSSLEQIGKEQEQPLPFLYPLRVISCSFLGHDTTCKGAVAYVFRMEVCALGTGFVCFPG